MFRQRVELRRQQLKQGNSQTGPSSGPIALIENKSEAVKKLLSRVVTNEKNRNFCIRMYKRRLLLKFKEEGARGNKQIELIIESGESIIQNTELIFDEQGNIYPISGSGTAIFEDSKYKKIPNAGGKCDVSEDKSETFNEAIKFGQSQKSEFPVVYVLWREEYDRFDGREFRSIPLLKEMFTYNDFKDVSKGL